MPDLWGAAVTWPTAVESWTAVAGVGRSDQSRWRAAALNLRTQKRLAHRLVLLATSARVKHQPRLVPGVKGRQHQGCTRDVLTSFTCDIRATKNYYRWWVLQLLFARRVNTSPALFPPTTGSQGKLHVAHILVLKKKTWKRIQASDISQILS